MRCLLVLCLTFAAAQGITVDRVAVTVGPTVITELQIDEDIRVAALLSGKPIVRDADARRAAADRLVEQLLIRHEIELSRYPGPTDAEVATLYAGVEQTLGGNQRLKELLVEYQISDQTLRAHLRDQLATLQFIAFRFRPDVDVSDSEVEQAYQREIANRAESLRPTSLPPLDASKRAKLAQLLVEERTDAALNGWLAESRKQVSIRYLDQSLQ